MKEVKIEKVDNEYLGKNETGSFEVDGTLRSLRKEVYLGNDSILKDFIDYCELKIKDNYMVENWVKKLEALKKHKVVERTN